MIYKNNYQRKQAIWREKWLEKEEKRLTQKVLLRKDVANFATTIQEAYQLIHNEILEIGKSAGEIVHKILLEVANEQRK